MEHILLINFAPSPENIFIPLSLPIKSHFYLMDLANSGIYHSLKELYPQTEIHKSEPFRDIDSSAACARNWMLETIHSIPGSLKKNNLLSFSEKNSIPEWLLTEISENNSHKQPPYRDIVLYTHISKRIDERKYSKVVCIGASKALSESLKAKCKKNGIDYKPWKTKQGKDRTLIRHLMTRWHILARLTLYILIWKIYKTFNGINSSLDMQANLLVFSGCPLNWRDENGKKYDRYLTDLPSSLEGDNNIKAQWIMSFFVNAIYPSLKDFIKYMSSTKKITDELRSPFSFIEDKISLIEIIKAFFDIKSLKITFNILRIKDHIFNIDGISVAPVFNDIIKQSIYSMPLRYLHANSFRKTITKIKGPAILLQYCFEQIMGKTFIASARKTIRNLKVLGLQHGPIGPSVIYVGISSSEKTSPANPDICLLDGEYSLKLMEQLNRPAKSLLALGALRLRKINPDEISLNRPDNKKKRRVLAAPGLHDCDSFIPFVIKALHGLKNTKITFKLHPLAKYNFEKCPLVKLLSEMDWKVENCPLPQAMKRSDIAIVSYSSAPLEALFTGTPLIEIRPDYGINWGLFTPKDEIPLAYSPEELRKILDKNDWQSLFNEKKAGKIIESCFGSGNIVDKYAKLVKKEIANL